MKMKTKKNNIYLIFDVQCFDVLVDQLTSNWLLFGLLSLYGRKIWKLFVRSFCSSFAWFWLLNYFYFVYFVLFVKIRRIDRKWIGWYILSPGWCAVLLSYCVCFEAQLKYEITTQRLCQLLKWKQWRWLVYFFFILLSLILVSSK